MSAGPELYYAIGGGLGHVSRALALASGLNRRPVVLASARPPGPNSTGVPDSLRPYIAELIAPPDGLARAKHFNRDPFARWLQTTVDSFAPRRLYIDAFPAGLFGELTRLRLPANCEIVHVARRLRWARYRRRLPAADPLRFARTYFTEELDAEQSRFLVEHSDAIEYHDLVDPLIEPNEATLRMTANLPRPLWLVAHAGDPAETARLLELARLRAMEIESPGRPTDKPTGKPTIALATDAPPPDFDGPLIKDWPIHSLFAEVDLLFTGCGSNTMRQTRHLEHHVCLPFARRFDDQHRRAAERRANRKLHVGPA